MGALRTPDDEEWGDLPPGPRPRREVVIADRRISRRVAIAIGSGILVVGLLVGDALGSSDSPKADTVTQVRTVDHTTTQVKTERVPVVRTCTVTQVKRIVRTQTQTRTVTVPVAAPPSSGGTPSDAASDGGNPAVDYAGMNCSEIGHSFNVTPGSEPEHDADNDGVACESY
jgi:hypothetical protein